ncbi:MAG: hypothetical protein ACI8RD_011299 [Bacillariaceae sp.]|jgi:hypothetical protein
MTRSTQAKRRLFSDEHDDVVPVPATADEKDETKTIREKTVPSTVAVMATPEKKRQRRSDDRDEGIAMYFSPKTSVVKKAASVMMVTPEKRDKEKQKKGTEHGNKEHVPIYIHKNVNYQRRGEATLSETIQKVFDFIEEHYVIPSNFESDRLMGPLSGTCFEVRVVEAYEKGLLLSANTTDYQSTTDIIICSHCADLGHVGDDCPKLI